MQNNTDNQVNAGFFVRLAAYLIDKVIIGVVLAIVIRFPIWISTLVVPNNIIVRDVIFEYSIKDMLLYLLGAIYFILLTYKTGETIGKRLLHIKVISVEDRKLTLFEVIYRETIGRFLSELIAYAGYLMIGLQKEKRGLHDLMADTKVVYCHKKLEEVETPVEYQKEQRLYVPSSYAVNLPTSNPEVNVENVLETVEESTDSSQEELQETPQEIVEEKTIEV